MKNKIAIEFTLRVSESDPSLVVRGSKEACERVAEALAALDKMEAEAAAIKARFPSLFPPQGWRRLGPDEPRKDRDEPFNHGMFFMRRV